MTIRDASRLFGLDVMAATAWFAIAFANVVYGLDAPPLSRALFSILIGVALWPLLFRFVIVLRTYRAQQFLRRMPSEVHLIQREDGWDAYVKRQDGDLTTVRLPDDEFADYDPGEDGGQRATAYVFEQLDRENE